VISGERVESCSGGILSVAVVELVVISGERVESDGTNDLPAGSQQLVISGERVERWVVRVLLEFRYG